MTIEEKAKILIVDDERLNRSILSELLSETCHVIVAKNGRQALERLAVNQNTDLILMDVMMPELNGYETIKKIKENPQTKEIPVIFITALDTVDDEERGLHLGAADYISKPFHPGIVKLRVKNHLHFVRQKKLLETLAGVDALTELSNRRTFDTILIKEWHRSSRNQMPLSLAMVDIDYFKRFNDHYGHSPGDQALKSVAHALKAGMRRETDLTARYGGEEFVLLFPDTDRENAKKRTEDIREAIEKMALPHAYSTANPFVTVSIGGATTIGSGQLPETLVTRADAMLYQAKKKGRNRVEWDES